MRESHIRNIGNTHAAAMQHFKTGLLTAGASIQCSVGIRRGSHTVGTVRIGACSVLRCDARLLMRLGSSAASRNRWLGRFGLVMEAVENAELAMRISRECKGDVHPRGLAHSPRAVCARVKTPELKSAHARAAARIAVRPLSR